MEARTWYSLYDRLLHRQKLEEAFRKVKSAHGAPGIDGQSCKDFATELDGNISELLNELKAKRYRPQPVKRVEIDKPDGGVRLIGIPTVRDRVVQQVLKDILEPIFDPHFHPSSYGYRPGKGAHDAIAKATAFILSGDFSRQPPRSIAKGGLAYAIRCESTHKKNRHIIVRPGH